MCACVRVLECALERVRLDVCGCVHTCIKCHMSRLQCSLKLFIEVRIKDCLYSFILLYTRYLTHQVHTFHPYKRIICLCIDY